MGLAKVSDIFSFHNQHTTTSRSNPCPQHIHLLPPLSPKFPRPSVHELLPDLLDTIPIIAKVLNVANVPSSPISPSASTHQRPGLGVMPIACQRDCIEGVGSGGH